MCIKKGFSTSILSLIIVITSPFDSARGINRLSVPLNGHSTDAHRLAGDSRTYSTAKNTVFTVGTTKKREYLKNLIRVNMPVTITDTLSYTISCRPTQSFTLVKMGALFI